MKPQNPFSQMLVCPYCKEPFAPKRPNQLFCTRAHTQLYHRRVSALGRRLARLYRDQGGEIVQAGREQPHASTRGPPRCWERDVVRFRSRAATAVRQAGVLVCRKVWGLLRHRAGLVDLRLHDLRRSCASELVEEEIVYGVLLHVRVGPFRFDRRVRLS